VGCGCGESEAGFDLAFGERSSTDVIGKRLDQVEACRCHVISLCLLGHLTLFMLRQGPE
jgi:hypothetical protein